MSRPRLLAAIQNGYDFFQSLLAGLDAVQMDQPGAVGKWSVKDTVAHIVVHEQRMVEWLRARMRGEHPPAFQPYEMPEQELHLLNEQIYQENLDRALEEVIRDLASTHVETLKLVAESPEKALFDPDCFQLQVGEPLWKAIAANTFEHYEEHGQDIRMWFGIKR